MVVAKLACPSTCGRQRVQGVDGVQSIPQFALIWVSLHDISKLFNVFKSQQPPNENCFAAGLSTNAVGVIDSLRKNLWKLLEFMVPIMPSLVLSIATSMVADSLAVIYHQVSGDEPMVPMFGVRGRLKRTPGRHEAFTR